MRRYRITTTDRILTLDADDFVIGDTVHLTRGEGEDRETVAIFAFHRFVSLIDITDDAIEKEEDEIIEGISMISLETRFRQLVNRLKAEGSIPSDWHPEDEG